MLRFRVYQVVAIVQAVARYCVGHSMYQELIFNLLVDDVLVAAGCALKGKGEREWCRVLQGWCGLGLVGHGLSKNFSVIA